MPIIPGSPTQVGIQLGSPVQIGNEEAARAQGSATSSFGRAAFDLGNKLDQVVRERNNKLEQEKLNAALEEYKTEQLKYTQTYKATDPLQDTDGVKAFSSLRENGNSILGPIAQKYSISADKLIAFKGAANGIDNQLGPAAMAASFAKIQEKQKAIENLMINQAAARVTSNLGTLDRELKKIELGVLEDSTTMPGMEVTRIKNAQTALVRTAITNLLYNSKRPAYKEAQDLLNRSTAILDEGERTQLFEKIRRVKTEQIALDVRAEQVKEKQFMAAKEAMWTDNAVNTIKYLDQAGANEQMRSEILNNVVQMEAAGKVRPGTAKELQNYRGATSDITDATTYNKILAPVILGNKSVEKGWEELKSLYSTSGVSNQMYTRINDELFNIYQFRQNRRDRQADIKVMGLKEQLDLEYRNIDAQPGITDQQKNAQRAVALRTYLQELKVAMNGGTPDFTGSWRRALPEHGVITPSPRTVTPGSREAATKQFEALEKAYREAKDPRSKEELGRQLKEKMIQIRELDIKQKTRGNYENSSGTDGRKSGAFFGR